ncbi:type II toxin-antitoxin system HicB family antitoxin [Microbulbifer sp. CAU 1566]|uniref:type II toxin-antitoxin system HicB family antitoxin n=1 Tax=unclassified Microbulbifer TaxID=2619833 RepID=UPI00135CC034|nr:MULTISPECIES: type II toxin-antitoxin system HicB family antitoxin [unclassified Microbulbifer]MCK7597840.1 type II toxin-antitoxin system HicB family antitoxin [Microbulbifer sp. CAU 1566]
MRYPVVVHNIEFAGYGAIAPDLPHCHCHGDTLETALQKMAETIVERLDELRAAGDPPPQPGDLEKLRKNPAFVGGVWAIIDIESNAMSPRS